MEFKLNSENEKLYKIISDKIIEEENIHAYYIMHIKTNAKILLFVSDDENRVFNIAFKTTVENGKGVPHILEHSVLCGSKKYDVKDPFIILAKTSLNTFLNAMTFPDKTCYPVASANLKDFHNLVSVYLDAVFEPNAIKNDKIFKQEGWHYEYENNDLSINGVVYNEMKGVFSDVDSLLETNVLSTLFDNTNYKYEYGGDPEEIIDLTYDEFVDFHKKYYSATNSIIFFYGKLDYNEELKNLNEAYLNSQEKIDINPKFLYNDKFSKNEERISYYNSDTEENDNSYIAYSFALGKQKSNLQNIVLKILDYILMSSDNAILKEELAKKGLGNNFYSKMEFGLLEGFYSIVAQEIDKNKKNEFLKTINDYIISLLKNGIEENMLKAGINNIYFSYEESDFQDFPKGLYFSLTALDTFLYDDNFYEYIEYKKVFEYLNSVDLNDKNNIFYKTLESIFIENNHTCINVLLAQYGLLSEKEIKLKQKIKNKNFTNVEIDQIKKDARELKLYQSAEDDEKHIASVPSLNITDIENKNNVINYKKEIISGIDTIFTFDNDKDIIYFDIKLDITDFSKEELYLIAIIKNLLLRIDLKNETLKDFVNFIDIHTGGVDINTEVYDGKILFSFETKVKPNELKNAFHIFYKLWNDAHFDDVEKIKIVLNELKTNSLLTILSNGHISTSVRAKSDFEYISNKADKINLSGIAFYQFVNSFINIYKQNSISINNAFLLLYKKLCRQKIYFTASINKKYYNEFINEFNEFVDKINIEFKNNIFTDEDKQILKNDIDEIKNKIDFDLFEKTVKSEAIVTTNDVNFCSIGFMFDKKLYEGKINILRPLFNYEYLWNNIRVLGGAYGCMFNFSRYGTYSFSSYRDPNLSKTNETFIGSFEYLKNVKKSKTEIEKLIISTIKIFDNPLSINMRYKKNINAYFNGITNEIYEQERNNIFETDNDKLNKISEIFKNIKNSNKVALIKEKDTEEAKKTYEKVWKIKN